MVERVGLRLTEDRVPANITSPGSTPTEVWLPKLLVKRNPEGVFTLLPQKEGGFGSVRMIVVIKKCLDHEIIIIIIVCLISLRYCIK